MPSIPATTALIAPEADQALTSLLDLHLRSQGVVLDDSQLRLVKQQGPVLQFLHSVVELGRRQLQEAQRAAQQVIAPADPVLAPPTAVEHPATTPNPGSLVAATIAAAALPPSASVIGPAPEAKRWSPPDFSEPDFSVRPVSEPISSPEVLPLRGEATEPAASVKSEPPTPLPPSQPVLPASPVGNTATPLPATSAQPAQPPAPSSPKPVVLPKLRLPNGTADTPYVHSFDLAKVPELAAYRITAISGLDGSGLSFDPQVPRIHGTPQAEAGKSHEFTFMATLERHATEGGKTFATDVNLFINPHPRSLWKEIDPDPTLEFQKPHKRSADHHSAGLRAVMASVRGRSHANSGTFREDDFHVRSDTTGNWTVIAVSDGAGSAKYSRRGSQLATEHSVDLLAAALPAVDAQLLTLFPAQAATDHATDAKALEAIRHALLDPVGRAAFQASKAIQAEAVKLNVEEKLLSATLLLAAVRPYEGGLLVAAYWVGDGAAAIFDPDTGTLHLLGDADAGEYSGQTRFLLSSEFAGNAWDSITKRFRCRFVPAGSTVVLMTDGVSDPKFGTDNSLRDPGRWLSWWRDDLCATVNLSRENVMLPKDLEAYLGFWTQGEHDDRTLALVY